MRVFLFYCLACVYVISGLQAQSTNDKPCLDWASLSLQVRSEIVSSLIFEEVDFNEQDLDSCLKKLSRMTEDSIGRGLSYTVVKNGPNAQDNHRDSGKLITMHLKSVTLREILKQLAVASGSKIEMTEGGILVTYGESEEEANP